MGSSSCGVKNLNDQWGPVLNVKGFAVFKRQGFGGDEWTMRSGIETKEIYHVKAPSFRGAAKTCEWTKRNNIGSKLDLLMVELRHLKSKQ